MSLAYQTVTIEIEADLEGTYYREDLGDHLGQIDVEEVRIMGAVMTWADVDRTFGPQFAAQLRNIILMSVDDTAWEIENV